MLHQVAFWVLIIGLLMWLFIGSWQIGSRVHQRKWLDASRELGMTAFHLLVGVVCFVIVFHLVPVTVEQPNGFQAFLLLLVPLVLLGRLVTRYMRI